MLEVPEIDEMICKELSHHNLAQCARVCKKWHRSAIPHLWHTLIIPTKHQEDEIYEHQESLRNMALEDYLYEQQLHLPSEGMKPQLSPFMPPLAKYGHWIRQLPQPAVLMHELEPPIVFSQPLEMPDPEITTAELLRHVYKRCSNLQVHSLDVTEYYPFGDISKTIAEFLLPTVRILSLHISDPWYLKYLLNHCTDTLVELSLRVNIIYDATRNDKKDQQLQQESKTLESLKKLTLEKAYDDSESKSFWPWLFERCSHVERLEVVHLGQIHQILADNMLTYMPNVNEIRFGKDQHEDYILYDKDVATLLSGSRQGWKVVEFKQNIILIFGHVAQEALTKHFPTLEKLILDDRHDFWGYDLAPILLSSPNLHSLTAFAIDSLSLCSLKTWPYETTLRVLKIRIVDIPRPDLRDYEILILRTLRVVS
ncbi:hypothetical protein BGZ65_006480, partial [Modicella reniformis]